MVLIPNERPALRVGDLAWRRNSNKFTIFDWESTPTLSGSGLSIGTLSNLYDNEYGAFCRFSSTPTIQANFPLKVIDSIVFGKTTADTVMVNIYRDMTEVANSNTMHWWSSNKGLKNTYLKTENDEYIVWDQSYNGYYDYKIPFQRKLAPEATKLDIDDQGITILTFPEVSANKVILTFQNNNGDPVDLYKLCICKMNEFPAPKSFSYPLTLNSNGTFSDYGLLYGVDLPSKRELSVAWDPIDDLVRRQFEEYAEKVKKTRAHFVVAMSDNDYFIPPLYAAATDLTIPNKKQSNVHWLWTAPTITYRRVE